MKRLYIVKFNDFHKSTRYFKSIKEIKEYLNSINCCVDHLLYTDYLINLNKMKKDDFIDSLLIEKVIKWVRIGTYKELKG